MEIKINYNKNDSRTVEDVFSIEGFYEHSCSQFSGWSTPDISDGYVDNNAPNYIWVKPILVTLIKQKLRRRKVRKSFLDHYLYLCSTVHYLKNIDRRYENKEFVPINSKILTSIISRREYSQIIRNLIEWGVIEVNDSYQADNFSKGFKLLPPYNTDLKRKTIKDKLINTNLNMHRKSSFKEIEKLPLPYKYLFVTNTWIKLDYKSAYSYNIENYFSNPSENSYDSNFYSISNFKTENYNFSVDKFANRAHTNLTNLKSDFRPFLNVDGRKLGQVDIKNSQPLFFYLHIKDNPEISESEKQRYKNIVESGGFYEFFMLKLNINLNKRSEIKNKILAALFFDRNRTDESRYVTVFKNEFPSIAAYIRRVRSNDHRRLAQLLQKAESKFIIEKAVAAFISKFGSQHKFINTIHDSIVVKIDMLTEAEQIIKDCFQFEGINGQLSTLEF